MGSMKCREWHAQCSLLIAQLYVILDHVHKPGPCRRNPRLQLNLSKTSSILLYNATWKCQQNWKRMSLAHTAASSSPYA